MFNKKMKSIICAMLFSSVLVLSVFLTSGNTIPILDREYDEESIEATLYNGKSYYYINPGTTNTYLDIYGSNTYPISAKYTNIVSGGAYGDDSLAINYRDELSPSLTSYDLYEFGNPTVDNMDMARLVEVDDSNPFSVNAKQIQPVQLHENHSLTYFADNSVEPWMIYQTDGPFLLDIEIHDPTESNVLGYVDVYGANPEIFELYADKTTFPIIPYNSTIYMQLSLEDDSLVTITPHVFETFDAENFNDFVPFAEVDKIPIDESIAYKGEIIQGKYALTDEEINEEDFDSSTMDDYYSMRFFEFNITEGEYYKIQAGAKNIHMDIDEGMDIHLGVTIPFLDNGDWENDPKYIVKSEVGSLSTGMIIQAKKTTTILLILFSQGNLYQEYNIFYQQYDVTEFSEETPLSLNTPTSIEAGMYNTFEITNPTVMAINYTGNSHYLDLSRYEEEFENWIPLYTTSAFSSFLRHVNGNIHANTTSSLTRHWYYIEPGKYAFTSTFGASIIADDVYQFNTLDLITLDNTINLDMSKDSLYAVEMDLPMYEYANITLSTNDQTNLTVYYDIARISKYRQGAVTPATNFFGTYQLGNEMIDGDWYEWGSNDSFISERVRARTYEMPIFIIHPAYAQGNGSAYPTYVTDTFDTTIKLSINSDSDYYPDVQIDGFVRSGHVIPLATPITDGYTFYINDDYSTDFDHSYLFPINLNPHKLYNLSIIVIGNYTDSDYNASISEWNVFNDYMENIGVFSSLSFTAKPFQYKASELLFPYSPEAYLYLYFERGGFDPYYNATIQFSLEEIDITELIFSIPQLNGDKQEYLWNATILDVEVIDNDTLLNQVAPEYAVEETPGFGSILSISTIILIVVPTLIYRRRRKS